MGNFDSVPLFLSVKQLAELTGEHVVSVRRGIAEGRIPADKVGGRWLICRDTVFPNARRAAAAEAEAARDGED